MNCDICKNKIENTFLGKLIGTMVRDDNHTEHYFCSSCQKKFGSEKELIAHMK